MFPPLARAVQEARAIDECFGPQERNEVRAMFEFTIELAMVVMLIAASTFIANTH